MPINFNQLAAIQAPSGAIATASAPPPPAPNNFNNEVAGGIMSGILQGQQMKQNAQAMQAQQQQMDFNKQNDPLVLEANRQKVESSRLDLQDRQAAQQAAAQLRDAAAKGEASYLDYLNKTNPDLAQKYNLTKAQINESISKEASNYAEAESKRASTYKTQAETTPLQIDNAGKITHEAALILNSVSGIKNPEVREQAYQQSLKFVSPATLKVLPPKYDEQVAAIVMNKDKLNYANAIDNLHKETKAKEPASDVEKKVEYLNGLRDAIDASPEGSQERTAAEAKYDDAVKIAKADNGLWSQIKEKIVSYIPEKRKAVKNKVTSKFQEGQIYKDANGNQAKYVQGQWVEVK